MPTIQLRKKTQAFLHGTKIETKFCIEVKHGRKWNLLGDKNGVMKFDTAEDRNMKIDELRGMEITES